MIVPFAHQIGGWFCLAAIIYPLVILVRAIFSKGNNDG